jgi:hypothetical protein
VDLTSHANCKFLSSRQDAKHAKVIASARHPERMRWI